jgi:hypothetical protein
VVLLVYCLSQESRGPVNSTNSYFSSHVDLRIYKLLVALNIDIW